MPYNAEGIYTRNTQEQTCTGCGRTDSNHRLIRPANGDPYYLTLCRTCESERNAARRARRNRSGDRVPGITSPRLGDRRRFGVEIECNIPGGYDGHRARIVRDALPSGWRMKHDGSLGMNGIEVVSPALQGQAGLDSLRTVYQLLLDNEASVDRRCGGHVHHEARDLGAQGLIRFARSYAANQDLIDWLVSPSRRRNGSTYCHRLTETELSGLRVYGDGISGIPSRYKTVNLHSFARYGTVEIRQHQGTLSFRKMEAWIKLGQGLLDAVAGRGQAFSGFTSLREFLNTTGIDEDAGAFLLGRAVQFNAPSAILAQGNVAVAA